jgi:hypothetical protein
LHMLCTKLHRNRWYRLLLEGIAVILVSCDQPMHVSEYVLASNFRFSFGLVGHPIGRAQWAWAECPSDLQRTAALLDRAHFCVGCPPHPRSLCVPCCCERAGAATRVVCRPYRSRARPRPAYHGQAARLYDCKRVFRVLRPGTSPNACFSRA